MHPKAVITALSLRAAVVSSLDCIDNTACQGSSTPACVDGVCVECEYPGDPFCPNDEDCCNSGVCEFCNGGGPSTSICGRAKRCDDSPDCGWWFPGLGGATCDNGCCADGWASCFPGRSLVQVQGKEGYIRMDRLKIGDYVRVRDGKYSRVHSFGHYQPQVLKADYIQLVTSVKSNNGTHVGKTLEISAEHLLYVARSDAVKKSEEVMPASEVQIGNYLITDDGPSQVVSIRVVQGQGLYSPLTEAGEIIVSGILASNYVSRGWIKGTVVSGNRLHLLQHGASTCQRFFCDWFSCCHEETYDQSTGFSPLVSFFYRLEQWQACQGFAVRVAFLVLLAPLFCFAIFIGQVTVAPTYSMVHLAVILTGMFLLKQKNQLTRTSRTAKVEKAASVSEIPQQVTHAQ